MYESLVQIPIDDFFLDGNVSMPPHAKSLVIFAHGSGSNRFSPRNKMVARELRKAGYATLLFDFMGEHEEENYEKRFDVDALSQRLVSVTEWIHKQEKFKGHDLAFFGAGLGSAQALNAAAELGAKIKAIVCRGAQTDSVKETNIPKIKSPTLLIAGENDADTIKINKRLLEKLTCPNKLLTIKSGGHLMQKPQMMQQVAEQSIRWYDQYLKKGKRHPELEYDTPDPEY